jgi:hypothetical protein
MQVPLDRLSIGFAAAVMIILVLIAMAFGLGYFEEIRRRRIDLYAKVASCALLAILALYFYWRGEVGVELLLALLAAIGVPALLCEDWSRLRAEQTEENPEG